MWRLSYAFVLLLATAALIGAESPRKVILQAPLSTMLAVPGNVPAHPDALLATVVVPEDAPADLGVTAWVSDDEGRWHQTIHPQRLHPGTHELTFGIGPDASLHAEGHAGSWSAREHARIHRCGLSFFSQTDSRAVVEVMQMQVRAGGTHASEAASTQSRDLRDLRIEGAEWTTDGLTISTGERLQLSVRPAQLPPNPCDPEQFLLKAHITDPDGAVQVYEGFYHEPQVLIDRGDYEDGIPAMGGRYSLRFRPARPGRYQLELETDAVGGATRMPLPDLIVTGPARDDYVRVDALDPRFFVTGQGVDKPEWFWPVGVNARSVWDTRAVECVGSRLSPDRRWHAYEAYLERWQAAGITAVEVWMSSWNLALEWRDDWNDYPGFGRYSQVNAERLDRLLDAAWQRGIRVILVINNHGQASVRADAEWKDNPYNTQIRDGGTPGPVPSAEEFWSHPAALAGQDRMRRYIIARWADHPAVMSWKLWSEQNLTAASDADKRRWHTEATKRWKSLDHYGHPVTTHWSSNYHRPDRYIVAMPTLDFACINAYHGRKPNRQPIMLADLLWDGLHDPGEGLGAFGKPIVITEYGGSHRACPEPQLLAEHSFAPWVTLMTGYGTGPMLWWFEWVDQRVLYQPYGAISRYLAGEDLRSQKDDAASARTLLAKTAGLKLWCRAWVRPGRVLGYLLDPQWGFDGLADPVRDASKITVGRSVSAGTMMLQWWDADKGELLSEEQLEHGGGQLLLRPPSFQRHIAFKLWREGE